MARRRRLHRRHCRRRRVAAAADHCHRRRRCRLRLLTSLLSPPLCRIENKENIILFYLNKKKMDRMPRIHFFSTPSCLKLIFLTLPILRQYKYENLKKSQIY